MIPPPGVLVDGQATLVPGGGGGIGRMVGDLLHALVTLPGAPPARILHSRTFRDEARRRYPADRLVEVPLAWRPFALAVMAGARFRIPFDAFYGRPAVVHSPTGYGPCFRHARLINHVHDLTWLEHPEWHTGPTASFLRAAAPVAARSASVVLTDSEFVRERVVSVLGVPRERTEVIPLPLGHTFRPVTPAEAREHVRRRFGLDGEFVLHVGTIEPRKNHLRLVEAFERLRADGFPGALVLVGRGGWRMEPILARIDASPDAAAIRRIADADDRDLVALYGACTVSTLPSLEEGFGYPLLESMACGAPCVTSDHGALTELAGGCALAVPATDADALADALRQVWRDRALRERLAAAGRARAEDYTFERWTERLFALYRRELDAAAAGGAAARPAPAAAGR